MNFHRLYWYSLKSIFTSNGGVISHLYTPLEKSSTYLKSTCRCLWRKLIITRQPITRYVLITVRCISNFTFHFNDEHVLIKQWEIFCNWFRLMQVKPIKQNPNFKRLLSRNRRGCDITIPWLVKMIKTVELFVHINYNTF